MVINNIIDINEATFESDVLEASVDRLIVVDFWAPWCGPCKQLTPVLEKIISLSPDKITLAKINIDKNQQIAAQLNIQSIPAVFAFKEKKPVNAFQGVISEKEIINFLEESLGEKLEKNFDDFYKDVEAILKSHNFKKAKTILENFIAQNSKEIKGICLYLDCLISMEEIEDASQLLSSLDDTITKNDAIQKIIKRINLINNKNNGPTLVELENQLLKSPQNIELVFKISENYFANNNFDDAFEILLKHYPKNKQKVKEKLLNFFDVLGFKNESVILYRKKLSRIMFS